MTLGSLARSARAGGWAVRVSKRSKAARNIVFALKGGAESRVVQGVALGLGLGCLL